MLDSLRDYSGSDRIGDGEFYVPSDGYSLKLILEISSEVSEGYSEQFSQERTGQFQTFIRIVVLVVGSPTSEFNFYYSSRNFCEEEPFFPSFGR